MDLNDDVTMVNLTRNKLLNKVLGFQSFRTSRYTLRHRHSLTVMYPFALSNANVSCKSSAGAILNCLFSTFSYFCRIADGTVILNVPILFSFLRTISRNRCCIFDCFVIATGNSGTGVGLLSGASLKLSCVFETFCLGFFGNTS